MPAGRPKGTYKWTKWTPEQYAELFWDAQSIAAALDEEELKSSKSLIASLLKQHFPEKYKHVTVKQMRNLLSKDHLGKKTRPVTDAFDEAFLGALLNETQNKE